MRRSSPARRRTLDRTICQLPDGYWWEVRLIQSLDSVHLHLHKGSSRFRAVTNLTSACVVLRFSTKSMDDAVADIIDRSHTMWQEFFRSSYNNNAEWHDRAAELHERLAGGSTKVKVTLDEVK